MILYAISAVGLLAASLPTPGIAFAPSPDLIRKTSGVFHCRPVTSFSDVLAVKPAPINHCWNTATRISSFSPPAVAATNSPSRTEDLDFADPATEDDPSVTTRPNRKSAPALALAPRDEASSTPSHHTMATFVASLKKAISSPATVAAMILLVLSVLFTPLDPALAVESGCRMGGSYGRQSNSRSYSAPSRSLGPASSYSRGFGQGYSSGYMSRPSVTISPFYSPFSTWSPFGYGWGYPSPGLTVVTPVSGILNFFFTGMFLIVFFTVISSFFRSASNSFGASSAGLLDRGLDSTLGPGVSVAQITVALEVPRRDDPNSILSFLQRLSRTAQTDSRVGLQNLVSQVALQLLRQKRSIFAASSKYDHFSNADKALREFNNLSVRERSKFERENTSNYGGVDYGLARRGNSLSPDILSTSQATVAVVTVILHIDGDSTKLPTIRSIADVETALSRIAADAKVDDCLRSAEILWTPEDRSETLSDREIMADYPTLRRI